MENDLWVDYIDLCSLDAGNTKTWDIIWFFAGIEHKCQVMCPSGLPLSYGQETESTYTFYYKEMLLCTVEFHLVNDLEYCSTEFISIK